MKIILIQKKNNNANKQNKLKNKCCNYQKDNKKLYKF